MIWIKQNDKRTSHLNGDAKLKRVHQRISIYIIFIARADDVHDDDDVGEFNLNNDKVNFIWIYVFIFPYIGGGELSDWLILFVYVVYVYIFKPEITTNFEYTQLVHY